MKTLALFLIRVYQYAISPLFPGSCRFFPTCSTYCYQAIETHGLVRGLWLGIRRLARCHPWCEGGEDPVPPCTNNVHSHNH